MSAELSYQWVDRALALSDLGRLDDAVDALRDGISEEPNDPAAHAMLAVVLAELEQGQEALHAAETSIALAPDLWFGHAARAQALLSLERWEDAEAAAREAIRLDPDDADSHTLLAVSLAARGRWSGALGATEEALSLDPESEGAQGLRAYVLAMSQGRPKWQEAAGDALAVGPGNSLAHVFVGHALLARGRERAAVERFQEALRLDPESEAAQAGLAEAMKASHPLFKPLWRFFMWKERLSTGAKVVITAGPLVVLRVLRPNADNPFVIGLIVAWGLFVVLTWAAVPIANVALRFSEVGRAVLPSEQKRSSTAFVAFLGAAVASILLGLAVSPTLAGASFTLALLAFPVGSAHGLERNRRRLVYAVAILTGLAAFAGSVLITVGFDTAGIAIAFPALLAAIVLLWVVRLS